MDKTPRDEKKKQKNSEVNDKVEVDFEPKLSSYNASDSESNDLQEVLSIAGRLKRRQQVRRYRARMQIARKRSMRRRATQARIKVRARRTALAGVKKKLAGGRATKDLTYSERARVERLAKRRKGIVSRRARRLVIQKRTIERNRLANRR